MKKTDNLNVEAIKACIKTMEDFIKTVELEKSEDLDVIYYNGAVVEDDYVRFEASQNTVEGKAAYGFGITYTDKASKKSDYWDGVGFFNGVLERDDIAIAELEHEKLRPCSYQMFIDFLRELKSKGWF